MFFLSQIFLALTLVTHIAPGLSNRCNARTVSGDPSKIICVCDSQTCDHLEFDWPQTSGETIIVESNKAGLRFHASRLSSKRAARTKFRRNYKIHVQVADRRQEILGWGGAFTDSAAINILSLPEKLGEELIESYYGQSGLQYNFGRVPIGGSDFSPVAYSYDDTANDTADYDLENWSLSKYDTDYKIPIIKRALRLAKQSDKTEVKLFASPWSPPKWMKTNNNFARGFLIDEDRIYKSYAEYLMKFYDAYEERGLNFWGATVQNEPKSAYLPIYFFNSLQFSAKGMANFIANYLGPALEARGKTKENFKLIVGDDSLYFVDFLFPTLLKSKEVQKYVSGFGFHWYTSGLLVPYDDLNKVLKPIQDKIDFVLMTEACTGATPTDRGVNLGSWERAEEYAIDIIEDLLRNTNGWIDWNLALDLEGGPNWSKNFVDSPIIVNATAGEFYKQPMYYALAHFTRFFKPGSSVVDIKMSRFAKIKAVAVHKADTDHLIINVLNKSDKKRNVQFDATLGLDNHTIGIFTLEPHSITTMITKI